jgi:replicative DNA helicase
MTALWARDRGFDEVSISQWFKDKGSWDSFGGAIQLSGVLDKSVNRSGLGRCVQIILDKSAKRALISAGSEVIALGGTDLPAEEAIDRAEEVLRGLNNRGATKSGTTAHEGVLEHINHVNRVQAGEDDETIIPTGIQPLDSILGGGFRLGWQVAVMSCAGHGKSALAINNFALSAAESGFPVLICSYEMPPKQVFGRMVAAKSGVPLHVQMKPDMDPYDLSKVMAAADALAGLPVKIEGPSCSSVSAIRRSARKHMAEHGKPGLVVVDYLQLMRGGASRRDSTQEEGISANTRGLKLLAVELNCVVVLLSQPTLEAKRSKRRPGISDAKGSGAIEDDADVALVPWLPHRLNKGMSKNLAEIGMEKFRDGVKEDLGIDEVSWVGSRMRFESLKVGWV